MLGAFLLLPDDLKSFGRSLAAAALSVSNFLFWQEAGYFDAPAGRKPLLHTWSLAVEEQFYIVFPLALLLLSRTERRHPPYTTVALLVLAVVVAGASWRWIERPFRGQRRVVPRRRLFAVAGIVMAAAVALGAALHLADGLPGRLPPEAVRLLAGATKRTPNRGACLYPTPSAVRDGRLCHIGGGEQARPTFVL